MTAPPIDHLPPEDLLDLAERSAALARRKLDLSRVGAVVHDWRLAPRRSILRDADGDLLHLCSDGSWTGSAPGHASADRTPDGGPWEVAALDVPDARHVTARAPR